MSELRVLLLSPSIAWRASARARLENVPGVSVVAARDEPGSLVGFDLALVSYSLDQDQGWSVVDALRGQMRRVLLVATREQDVPLLTPLCKTLRAEGVLPPLESPRFVGRLDAILKGSGSAPSVREQQASRVDSRSLPPALPSKKTPAVVSKRDGGPALIVIGASTGGVEAVREVLASFPADTPPTLLVQHIRGRFAESLADSLDSRCACEVRLARDNDALVRGRILIAPGDHHIFLARAFGRVVVRTDQGPEVSHHRPSVDRLFESVAQHATRKTTGVLLTGMGRDGAAGLLAMRRKGMYTIAQDEHTSTVYGMPKAAVALGAVQDSLPLDRIAEAALSMTSQRT